MPLKACALINNMSLDTESQSQWYLVNWKVFFLLGQKSVVKQLKTISKGGKFVFRNISFNQALVIIAFRESKRFELKSKGFYSSAILIKRKLCNTKPSK